MQLPVPPLCPESPRRRLTNPLTVPLTQETNPLTVPLTQETRGGSTRSAIPEVPVCVFEGRPPTRSSLTLPISARKSPLKGVVLAWGSGRRLVGNSQPLQCEEEVRAPVKSARLGAHLLFPVEEERP
jgi:hypothetical protein